MKNPPFNGPLMGNRYSRLKANLKLASLNSLILLLLPGPNSYALQALLSFAPPEKYERAKGTFDELPYGIAIPENA